LNIKHIFTQQYTESCICCCLWSMHYDRISLNYPATHI